MGAFSDSSSCVKRYYGFRRVKPGAIELPGTWDAFRKECHPTKAEGDAMMRDLFQTIGSWNGVAQILGIDQNGAQCIVRAGKPLTLRTARMVWLSWLLICRPEVFPMTFFQLACWGRTTVRANPATAGQPVRRPEAFRRKMARRPPRRRPKRLRSPGAYLRDIRELEALGAALDALPRAPATPPAEPSE